MAKRFGRNQKRVLLQEISKERQEKYRAQSRVSSVEQTLRQSVRLDVRDIAYVEDPYLVANAFYGPPGEDPVEFSYGIHRNQIMDLRTEEDVFKFSKSVSELLTEILVKKLLEKRKWLR